MADLGQIKAQKVFTPAGIPVQDFDALFQPYATDIGFLIFAWNNLHEELARLFCVVTQSPDSTIPLAIWHSTQSDRARRQMLKEATKLAFANSLKDQQQYQSPIKWLLDQCDTLEEDRNNAVHAPLTYFLAKSGPEFAGAIKLGNPRALKLAGKRLSIELKWHRHRIDVLAYYAENLHPSLRHKSKLLPSKPQMPQKPKQ
jgi:hypothetical protein